eukprot:9975347-Alexandrium_andersonii.AAC.1
MFCEFCGLVIYGIWGFLLIELCGLLLSVNCGVLRFELRDLPRYEPVRYGCFDVPYVTWYPLCS